MMVPKTFAAACVAALALLVAANVATARLTRNAMPRQLLRALEASSGVEVLALGNSLIQHGFDPAAFASVSGHPTVAVNAGLGFTGPVQHLLIGRHALSRHAGIKTIVYGYFDFMLTDSTLVAPNDLWGNNAMSFYVEPDVAARHLFDAPHERALFNIARRVPAYVERGTLWARVERMRRALSGYGLPSRPAASAFAALEAASPRDFSVRAAAATRDAAPLTPALAELFVASRSRGVRTIAVEMPMPRSHRDRFYARPEWAGYVAHTAARLEAAGVEVVRAADWLADERFVDAVHADAQGAVLFSARLARWMQGRR